MEAYATVEDLEKRWRTLTEEEAARAEVELEDASAFIKAQLDRYGIAIDADNPVQESNLRKVTCSVARRALAYEFGGQSFGSAGVPLNGYKQTADVFTEEFSFANPMGDTYLTAAEKSTLGIGRMRVKSVPAIRGCGDARLPCGR